MTLSVYNYIGWTINLNINRITHNYMEIIEINQIEYENTINFENKEDFEKRMKEKYPNMVAYSIFKTLVSIYEKVEDENAN